ncbi:NnrU family protein [Stappia sp.]|uniref:NnrU family protein n=1 Tax=Stappia sp. TaxID=1870903 RepID=UPI003A98FD77
MAWAELAIAFSVFFASHSLPLRPAVRSRAEGLVGRRTFLIAYSTLSVAVLAWLIVAAGRAPYVALWPWRAWQMHVPALVMLPACLLVALAIARPNPFSFGGRDNDTFDPDRPGLVRWCRHPLLAAMALWAAAHVIANGDLAHALLFGTFAAFALAGMKIIDRRRQREMGAGWLSLSDAVAASPLLPVPVSSKALALRLAAGLCLYLGLLLLHPLVIGVSPLP